MTTIPFGPRNENADPLLTRAGELSQDVAPPRDLWPAIEARLQDEPRRRELHGFGWPAALAAGFLVAAVSALLTWGLVREPAPVTAGPAPAPQAAIVPVNYGSNSGLTASELAVRDELLAEFRRKVDQLSPQTREAVIKNLAIIQRAADEIDAALAQDPASGMLNGLLFGAYKQELQLYSNVVTAGGGATRST